MISRSCQAFFVRFSRCVLCKPIQHHLQFGPDILLLDAVIQAVRVWPAINLIQNAILCKIGAGLHIGHRVRVAGAVRNQRSVAVCHWVAFAFPGQPGALLAIELGHGLRRGVAQIDDSHHFHIVDAMARTGAQVELVRRFTAPNGDKPSRVFLRFRRVGAVVEYLRLHRIRLLVSHFQQVLR